MLPSATAATTTANCWFLTGPTAAGKTAIGIELARLLQTEIISLDSMAVYRGLDIGTAKPTAEERAAVPHHLVDVVAPDEDYSLARYVADAGLCTEQIRARGASSAHCRQPLFVGGSPLYLKALLRGIFSGPPADWPLRQRLAAFADQAGDGALHARLAEVDTAAAARLPVADRRRIIRALEVYELTGTPISTLQAQFDHARPAAACRVFVLDWPRPVLYERIERRVDAMFAAGLVAEVEQLLSSGITLSHSAGQALGYREVLEHLAGRLTLPDAIALVKTRTRQFAKRQLTWFRSLSECRFVAMDGAKTPATIAAEIFAAQ